MSNTNDFVIENGVLKKYTGAGGDVVIPDGVKSIESCAFQNGSGIVSIVIPDGVTSIGEEAFIDFKNLQNITLPGSLKKIGSLAFGLKPYVPYGFPSDRDYANIFVSDVAVWQKIAKLFWASFNNYFPYDPSYNLYIDGALAQDITLPDNMTSIAAYMFCDCMSLRNVTIPDGVKKIEERAFSGCANLKGVTILSSVTGIGNSAFSWCRNLQSITIPESVKSIGDNAFYGCEKLKTITVLGDGKPFDGKVFGDQAPMELINADKNLHTYFSDQQLAFYLLKRSVWSKVSDDVKFAIFRERSGQWFVKQLSAVVTKKDAGNFAAFLLTALSDKPSQEDCSAAARLLKTYSSLLPAATVKKLDDALPRSGIEDQTTTEAVQESSSDICLSLINESKLSSKDITAKLKDYYAITIKELPALESKDHEYVDPLVLGWLLVVHGDFPKDKWDLSDRLSKYKKTGIKQLAVKVIEQLDPESFQKALESLGIGKLVTSSKSKKANLLHPICRYADERHFTELLKEAPTLMTSQKANSPSFAVLRRACLFNNSRPAILFAEKYGDIDIYAKLRGTDADTLRDAVLSDSGLDADGKKTYDLGGTTVTATLQADLTLSLFDAAQNKIVKSMPKKGNDEALVAAASTDFAELKKNIKKAAHNRCDNLFADFLSGKEKKGGDWQKTYLTNPLLRQIANLLVWEQNGVTFTLYGKDAILADGAAYSITDKPIKLAHPMEMKAAEVTAWQKYFNANGLKQPFAQIWEPVYDLPAIDKNRYNGIHIPAYRFSKQEKHGISFNFEFDISEAYLTLNDCELDFDGGTAIGRHELDLQGELILGTFAVKKPSRQANHIVSLLDKWTVYGRIIKDDVTVLEQLGSVNVAQLMEYIRVAGENNAVNITAALMEYKNEHFADFDPMDEFVL